MKSFFSFFALFIVSLASIFVVAYHADTLIQKTADLTIKEWELLQVSDHREAYPGVVYTRYVDGQKLENITTPWLLLDWNALSQQISDLGNNTKERKIERSMKDDFQTSKEFLANITIKNTAPQLWDITIRQSNLESIAFSFSAFDPARDDYPLVSVISLKDAVGNVLHTQEILLDNAQSKDLSFPTSFERCNSPLLLHISVRDELESVSYTTPLSISCPISTTIDVAEDLLSPFVYHELETTEYSALVDTRSDGWLFKHSLNILFSKLFLQAVAVRRMII
jgi:hypothetical protein